MIEIRGAKAYRGPSVWARVPVVRLSLEIGGLQNRPMPEEAYDRTIAAQPRHSIWR